MHLQIDTSHTLTNLHRLIDTCRHPPSSYRHHLCRLEPIANTFGPVLPMSPEWSREG